MDEQAAQRLRILDALVLATDRRDELVRIVGAAASANEARAAVCDAWGLDEVQATAVLDLQIRRFAAREREQLAAERDHRRG